jgi:hypothetical protein
MTVGGGLRRFVPPGIRAALSYVLKGRRDPGMSRRLARLRETIWTRPNALVRFAGYEIRIAEGSSFYHQCRYVFADRVYHFEAQREDPADHRRREQHRHLHSLLQTGLPKVAHHRVRA